jgi:hypothetical protein
MKLRIIASALLIAILSVGVIAKSDAAPWRGCYWPVVRVCAPAVRICAPAVAIGGYYGGYYARPHYSGARYCDRGGYRHNR